MGFTSYRKQLKNVKRKYDATNGWKGQKPFEFREITTDMPCGTLTVTVYTAHKWTNIRSNTDSNSMHFCLCKASCL